MSEVRSNDSLQDARSESPQKSSRRAFLKAAGVGGAVVAIGSLGGCSNKVEQSAVVRGKSKKQEVLYRGDTKYWQTYFSVAK